MVNDIYKTGAEHVAHHSPIEKVCVGAWVRGIKQFNFLLEVGLTSRQNQALSTGPLYLHTVDTFSFWPETLLSEKPISLLKLFSF